MNPLTNLYMYLYIFGPSARGVETTASKMWFKRMYRDYKRNGNYTKAQKRRAYREGSLPEHVDRFGPGKEGDGFISERDYLYLQPLNGIYSKWLLDSDVVGKVFAPFAEHLDLEETPKKKKASPRSASDMVASYLITELSQESIPPEGEAQIRVIVTNEKGYNPEITESYDLYSGMPQDISAEAADLIRRMCLYAPQLAFFAVDLRVREDDSFKIRRILNTPEYPKAFLFSERTASFLNRKRREREQMARSSGLVWANMKKRIHFKLRQVFAVAFFPAGMLPYLCTRWMKEVCQDFFSRTGVSLRDKLWAYKHGFLSYRLPQYGITRENHGSFISDYEYKYLRHINGDYRALFEDKITIKYIFPDFRDCFPGYYYHIKTDSDGNVIIPMMDCPAGYGRKFEDILRLAKQLGVLALKPDEGSHGDGFYRLAWEDGRFTLNGADASEREILEILQDRNNQYLVTEYIANHPQFKEIYSGAVNTIRMIVFKEEDGTPVLGNVYMRFGSKQTGAVDNMGAGGMFVQVDAETGWYHNAKIIRHNFIEPCKHHPDSGVLMEGFIPHWPQVKETILAIAASVPRMEYFGFDVAVTEDGIKLPEINRFPDYPKIETFSPLTIKYLLRKLEEKKRAFGYDWKPCQKLFGFPERAAGEKQTGTK